MTSKFLKDPSAILDYQWDWSQWLGMPETIQTATVTVPTGITKDSQTNTTTTVTVWLSGGSVPNTYTIICRIVTNQGRTDERSITVAVVDR